MKKLDELGKALSKFGKKAKALDLTLADGGVVEVETEDGEIVGKQTNAPDGTHDLQDGRSITVVDGVIAEVAEAKAEAPTAMEEEMEALKAELAAYKEKETEMQATAEALAKEIESVKALVSTNGKAGQRQTAFGQKEQRQGKAFEGKYAQAERLATKALEEKAPWLGMTDAEFRKYMKK